MSFVITEPYQFIAGLDGDALDAGYIYYGEPNKDPIQYPKAVYFDENLTIPAPQPLRTVNGYVVRNGSPAFLFANSNYSILVLDAFQRQVYSVADFMLIGNASPVVGSDVDKIVSSIAELRALDKTKWQTAFATGYYVPADGGGGMYWQDASDTTSPDNGGSIIVAADGARWKLVNTSVMYPEQFGAKGDGVANDTAFLQAWLNALPNKTGRMRGVTYLSAQVSTPGNVKIEGVPGVTVIKAIGSLGTNSVFKNATQSGSVDTYPNQNISIDGVIFDGSNLATRPAELVSFSKVQHLRMSRCGVRNVGYIGMAIGGSRDVEIETTEFTGCGDPAVTAEGGPALWLGAAGDGSNSFDLRVTKNYFHDNQWSGMYGSGLRRLIFSGNNLTNNRESSVFINSTASEVTLADNIVDGAVKKNISASGFELGCGQVNVTGNSISNTGNDNISLTDVVGAVISGNMLISPRTDTVSFPQASCIGIITTSAAPNNPRYINITGNEMVDGANAAYAAVAVGNSGAAVEFVSISGNNMSGTTWSGGKAINLAAGKWAASSSHRNNVGYVDNTFSIGQFQSPAASGSQSITGIGFRPSFIEISAVEASAAQLHSSIGCARVDPVSGAITYVVTSMSADGSSGAGGPGAAAIVQINSASGAARSAASVTAMGDDGFTLNWTIIAGQPWCSYKAYP